MSLTLTTANATLADMVDILRDQRARRHDVIANSTAITARGGRLVLGSAEPVLTPDGVTAGSEAFIPTDTVDQNLADKLGIGIKYIKFMRINRPDLWDMNVNGLLHGGTGADGTTYSADNRKFMLRCLREDGGGGIVRGFLSDSYRVQDNLDVLMACLEGLKAAGIAIDIKRTDLTERRMYVRLEAPEIGALAPALLHGYVSPFTGRKAEDNPFVSAGMIIRNSENGWGARSIAPYITVLACDNGMTFTAEADRRVHLGSRQAEGLIRYQADTLDKELALITAEARDAAMTFISPEFVATKIRELEIKAGIEVKNPVATIAAVVRASKSLPIEAEDELLAMFTRGGQCTAGGVMQAATAYAQTVDADARYDIEAEAQAILGHAARLATV